MFPPPLYVLPDVSENPPLIELRGVARLNSHFGDFANATALVIVEGRLRKVVE
jgi:hypothetical protein